MKRRLYIFITFTMIVALVLVVHYLFQLISGANLVQPQVAEAARTNQFIARFFGEPIRNIAVRNSPTEIRLDQEGNREGFSSLILIGAVKKQEIKVEWKLPARCELKIIRISLPRPFRQDKLLWEDDQSGRASSSDENGSGKPKRLPRHQMQSK